MTGHLIGTAGVITAQRDECEDAINQLAGSGTVDAQVITKLRRQLGNELADLVVSVAALQKKAQKKFGQGVWWVTEKSLQQATPWQVAQLKASWFDHRLVYDLCCGVGGDAIRLAKRGRLVAVDSDATIVEMAAANLARSGATSERAIACCADVTGIEIPDQAAVHIDPDRRGTSCTKVRRVDSDRKSRPEYYHPAWSQVLEMIRKTDCAVVKLAPAAKIETTSNSDEHRCWISLQGTVREQSLLHGDAIDHAGLTPNARSAVSLAADGSAAWFAPSAGDLARGGADVLGKPLSVLIDPVASIRAAGLTETFASQHRFKLLGSASGFVTCEDAEPMAPAVATMAVVGHVIWSGACDDRKLRRELRRRGFYPAVVKVRGTDHDPAMLAKRYRKCGEQPVTLWIGRSSDRVFAAITTTLSPLPL